MDHAQSRRLLRQTAQKHGLEELPLAQGQGGGREERGQGSSREELPQQLRGCTRAKRSYSTFKVRRGGREEIYKTDAKASLLPCVYLEVKCPETLNECLCYQRN